jgi:adenosylcobinamide-GDP ribazoletransferase
MLRLYSLKTMISFFAALQFLTQIPPIIKRPFTEKELGRAVGFYPLVGLLIGILLLGANALMVLVLPPPLRAALVLTIWVLIPGALHLDGFLDACDGILGGFTPVKRMEIMRDEAVGAFGLAGGVLLLLLKFTALQALGSSSLALLLIPTLSRWGISMALIAYPYARPKGLGRDIKDHAGWKELVMATLIAGLTAWFSFEWLGMVALGVSALVVWLTASFILRRIPGLTGDIYGAINELVEVVLLVVFVSMN